MIKKVILTILVLILFLFFPLSDLSNSKLQENDIKLNYDVSVDAVIIPVFAMDKNGAPVFDLKKEDLILYVEGKPVEINSLSRYLLEESEKYLEKTKKTIRIPEKKERIVRERYVFLIIDSVFNSRDGFRRTKEIAEKLINQEKSGDKYIVVEIHPIKGLNYIGGAETNKKVLIEKIKKLKLNFNNWSNELFRQKLIGSNLDNSMYSPFQETENFFNLRNVHLDSERRAYRNLVVRYSSLLSKFKYALKSIVKPKIVFLISEGISKGAFNIDQGKYIEKKETTSRTRGFGASILFNQERKDNFKNLMSGLLLGYLKDVVEAINRGNSVLYSINPAKPSDSHQPNISGEMSLKYLAGESGGKYYTGTNAVEIVERIKKNTSAYYELSFLIPVNMKKNLHIKIRCKRRGVKINTVQYTELKKKYTDMDELQKKIFAYNLAKGGKWSNLIAKVPNEKISINKTESKKENIFKVKFPYNLAGKYADIYIITENPKNSKVDIKKRKNVLLKKIEEFKTKNEKNKKHYIVVVEPKEILSLSIQLK